MKIKRQSLISVLSSLALPLLLCRESPAKDFKSIDLRNGLITVQIVPEIGGRIIQFKLGDYSFFWVNDQLKGTKPPASRLGPNGEWLNYGGDKLWPAPQGWDNDQQWPGPPDPVLDGGPYTAHTIKENNRTTAIRLTSQKDKRSGIQFSRMVRIFDDSTHVSLDVTMKNIDTKPRRWGIWAVTQFDTGNRHGEGFNENYWAYCPLKPDSIFHKGFRVLYGLVNNQSFKPDYDNQIMRVHYERRVGKIGLDSSAGWVATVDATDGYVFVHRFTYEPDKPYPDDSSVEFWTNGLGEFAAWGKIIKMPENIKDNPYLMETEILSPFAALDPGQSYTFHYDWYAAKIPPASPVIACSDIAVTCKPFFAELRENRISLKGRFGLFYNGYITLVFFDRNDKKLNRQCPHVPITPLKALDLSTVTALTENVQIPEQARKVAIYMYDAKGKTVGRLGQTQILAN